MGFRQSIPSLIPTKMSQCLVIPQHFFKLRKPGGHMWDSVVELCAERRFLEAYKQAQSTQGDLGKTHPKMMKHRSSIQAIFA